MAKAREQKPKRADSCNLEMVNVRALVAEAEQTNEDMASTGPRSRQEPRSKCHLFRRFVRSRYIGLVVGPLYGVFFYYYLTILILSGPPFDVKSEGNLTEGPAAALLAYTGQSTAKSSMAEPHLEDPPLVQYVGVSIGGGCAVFLAAGSFVSSKTRCAMMLIIPSLAAKRGRAFLLTSAAGMVLRGPINTIDHNIQQVISSLTCMYEQMKSLADLYLEQFQQIWNTIQQILTQVNEMIEMYREQLAQLAASATEDARREIEEAQQALERQADELKDKLSDLRHVLDAPGKAAGWVCDQARSALAIGKDVGNAIADGFKSFFTNPFGRRRKRNSCGIPPVVPDFNLELPDANLNALKDFLSKLKPDLDIIDFDLEQVLGELEHNNIREIRERLKNILKSVFQLIKDYSGYLAKLFYLSIILIVIDAIRFMKTYYADDAFDNMMVDDNLRQLWSTGRKENILPLRRWELKTRYQYSKSVKVSKGETKRIVIQLIPTLLFIVVTALIMTGDYGLSALLTVFREEAKFGISFNGSETGVNFKSLLGGLQTGDVDVASIKLEGFNLTTEPCLPHPKYTDLNVIVKLSSLMAVALILGIVDAYGSRTRSMICNVYFTKRAMERAEYLYRKIQTGRRTRRIQLSMIVTQEMDRRYRTARFCCPCFYDMCCKSCSKKSHNKICPACLHGMKKNDEAPFSLTREGNREEIAICKDCHKDIE